MCLQQLPELLYYRSYSDPLLPLSCSKLQGTSSSGTRAIGGENLTSVKVNMSGGVSNASFVLLGLLAVVFFDGTDATILCRILPLLPASNNTALKNHVIANMSVDNVKNCAAKCFLNPRCASVNYQQSTDKVTCELSSSDHLQHPLDLVPQPGFMYRGTKNGCSSHQCPENATCFPGLSPDTHNCACPEGYTGAQCENDVDECSSDDFPCDTNATCSNTHGSFVCACKHGFTGDGLTCKDVNECELPNDCHVNATCHNTIGSYTCTCQPSYLGDGFTCLLKDADFSCKDIFKESSIRTDKAYTMVVGSTLTEVYCQMSSICGSGGWTLVMKADGSNETFEYDSPLWSNKLEYNPKAGLTGLDEHETKLSTYWSVPFEDICIGMKVGDDLRWLNLHYPSESLYDVIADGTFKNLSMPKADWLGLIADSELQKNCGRNGFNNMKVRIGIIGNGEDDCRTPDSELGFGTKESGYRVGNTCQQTCQKRFTAFGYIFVK
ncbi:uncharacterized protein LOC116620734 [Nematostella vectensis]|uniref:uncharacterized protein LOC116620734 n=1 Tax=Nematostella vectensis TaxID=45351 RepID=UPI00138FB437|nr:uncharacterized protein LOC116620734 [Nematostella vectensis]